MLKASARNWRCILSWLALIGLSSHLFGTEWVQEAYLWQRQWTPQVVESVRESSPDLKGLQILAAEISWDDTGQPHVFQTSYDAQTLKTLSIPLTLVMRIGPYSRPFSKDDTAAKAILAQAERLLTTAQAQGIEVTEFQVDFDCAESKLGGYREWLLALRQTLQTTFPNVGLSFTALPVWLRHTSEFRQLAEAADSFVLQVHSLEKPTSFDAPITLCDTEKSLAWITQASTVGTPFRVALPTYGYEVVFDAEGHFKALVAEGPRPQWTEDTRIRIVRSDPTEMACLAQQLSTTPPTHCQGIIWFRLPVAGDRLNWSPRTLQTILEGKIPTNGLSVDAQWSESSDGLATIYLENTGDTALPFPPEISLSWDSAPPATPVAWDSNGIFSITVNRATRSAHISTTALPASATLAPGQRLALGWLRFRQPVSLQVHATDVF
ncbi:MAG: DUF3142 domain-containing protein [Verrucomicrobiota bacterium JB024]|nr:DUF3142 domain-containing protein [Verrucomicrobiota bacterium JB024]